MLYCVQILSNNCYTTSRCYTPKVNIQMPLLFQNLYISLVQMPFLSVQIPLTDHSKDSGYTNILQDKTLFCAFEAGNIVCWLVNPPIAKLDLFKSLDCRWICKTYAEYCYRNLATVRRLVQSPTLQLTIFCGVHSDLRGKGIRVSPAWS